MSPDNTLLVLGAQPTEGITNLWLKVTLLVSQQIVVVWVFPSLD